MNFTSQYHELDLKSAYDAGLLRAKAGLPSENPFWDYQLPLKEAYDRGYSAGM
jgi:hypothetical protein